MPRIGKYWLSLDLYYWPKETAHTWAKVEPDNKIRVGVDDFAQKQAGELLFIRLFPVGKEVKQGARFGTLETAKWVGPLLSPVSGKIAEVNDEVLKTPKLVNEDPYGKGWMIAITPIELEEDLSRLVKGDEAIEWLKKDIREVAKEEVT
ncbi:glycine cleavage system protein H [Chloroflexota bacterium]